MLSVFLHKGWSPEPGLLTAAVRNSEILLLPVLGMDRTDQSCLIASSRQQGSIHPSSPGPQLVLERDWSLNWDVCGGGNDPKCCKREAEQVYQEGKIK